MPTSEYLEINKYTKIGGDLGADKKNQFGTRSVNNFKTALQ